MEQSITMDEIAKHNTKEDCWFAINETVYDVTKYIADGKHPGKEAIIQGCGKDATELFNTRPMGSGTTHSSKARSFLPSFIIGKIAQ
jgi:cytochrome b involved in lipid metabolism